MNKKSKAIFNRIGYVALIFLPFAVFAFLTELLTQPRALLTGWFWLSVLINMGPVVIVVGAAWWLAGRFAQRVDEFDDLGQAIKFLMRRRFGKVGFSPFVTLSQGTVVLDRYDVVPHGGPATLVVHNDTAAVLQKAGQLTRVLGPGFSVLEPFEKIYNIIDLRPKCWELAVNAMTKEGIPITWEVEVQYQINDNGQKPSDQAPYPFVEEEVFQAATTEWRRERDGVQDIDWEGWIVVSQTQGTLRSILARRCLDELIGLTEADQLAIRESIQMELEETIRQVAPEVGAKILEVKLDNLKVDDEVTQQWIENWRTHWHNWSISELAKEEAESIEAFEMAEAESHLLPLNLLTKELQALESGQDIITVISMRLISALAQARLENEVFVPSEALDTLRKFQELLNGGPTASNQHYADPQFPPPSPPVRLLPLKSLPLLGEVAAGKEAPAFDDVLGEIQQVGEQEFEFDGRPLAVKEIFKGSRLRFAQEYEYVAVPVSGDSMDRAGIAPGDYVILQTPNVLPVRPAPGDVVAVAFCDRDDNTQATLKRIYFEADRVVLQPESSNPEHEPRILHKDAFAGSNPGVKVVGIVVAVLGYKNGRG
jgi:regulator of protease activity HflC (stomatin/prohibitin superfamily)